MLPIKSNELILDYFLFFSCTFVSVMCYLKTSYHKIKQLKVKQFMFIFMTLEIDGSQHGHSSISLLCSFVKLSMGAAGPGNLKIVLFSCLAFMVAFG